MENFIDPKRVKFDADLWSTYRSRNCATKTRFVRISNALYARSIKIALKTNANQRNVRFMVFINIGPH